MKRTGEPGPTNSGKFVIGVALRVLFLQVQSLIEQRCDNEQGMGKAIHDLRGIGPIGRLEGAWRLLRSIDASKDGKSTHFRWCMTISTCFPADSLDFSRRRN